MGGFHVRDVAALLTSNLRYICGVEKTILKINITLLFSFQQSDIAVSLLYRDKYTVAVPGLNLI